MYTLEPGTMGYWMGHENILKLC